MRTIFLTILLLLTLTACAGKEDAPIDGTTADTPAAEEAATEDTPADDQPAAEAPAAEAPAEDENVSVIDENLLIGPVGDIRMANGSVLELTSLDKIGKYYIYISGKLNGRSSTVISFTRLDDLARWKSITFQDPHNFTITTRGDQQLNFMDSRVYIGSDSHETYTFQTTPESSYQAEQITVKKQDVKVINFTQPTED